MPLFKSKTEEKPVVFTEKVKKRQHRDFNVLFDERDIQVQKRKEKKLKNKVKPSFAEISPIVDITANGFFEMSDKGYMEILQLSSQDIYSLNENEKNRNIYSLAAFFQWYLNDIKIVPLNFPVDTSTQQRYLKRKMERVAKAEYIPFLEERLKELQFIENERTNREYYMFIYADDEYTLLSRIRNVERMLQMALPIIRLEEEKKINILYKLFNLNSKYKSNLSE